MMDEEISARELEKTLEMDVGGRVWKGQTTAITVEKIWVWLVYLLASRGGANTISLLGDVDGDRADSKEEK